MFRPKGSTKHYRSCGQCPATTSALVIFFCFLAFQNTISRMHSPGTSKFFTYMIEFLENPGRSGTLGFDQHRYATAAMGCLQLCLCSHHELPKGHRESAYRDKVLRRNKPWAWKARLGVHSRIRKAASHLTVQRWKSLKFRTYIGQYLQNFNPHTFFPA